MEVTDIRQLDKKRSRIYIDGDFAFVLYNGEIRDYKIKVGGDLSDSAYEEIMSVVLPKRVKLRAMNLLQKKDYTEKQLRDKLKEGDYPEELINEAIDYVKSYKYLDDERYSRDYITYHISTRSKNRIIQDLSNKGISSEVYENILTDLYEEESDAEIEQIIRLLDKKHYVEDVTPFDEKQKIIAFLMRKGYSLSDIKKAMAQTNSLDT